jgi:hypothetical protein
VLVAPTEIRSGGDVYLTWAEPIAMSTATSSGVRLTESTGTLISSDPSPFVPSTRRHSYAPTWPVAKPT